MVVTVSSKILSRVSERPGVSLSVRGLVLACSGLLSGPRAAAHLPSPGGAPAPALGLPLLAERAGWVLEPYPVSLPLGPLIGLSRGQRRASLSLLILRVDYGVGFTHWREMLSYPPCQEGTLELGCPSYLLV